DQKLNGASCCSFVSSLINLESLSFGGQGRIQPRWWTSITAPFGFIWNQQHPQRLVWSSLAGLHMLTSLNLSYCNLLEVPENIGGLSCLKELNLEGNNLLEVPGSIGGLSCLEDLYLSGNNFTNLPGSLNQLSHLKDLDVSGCKKLKVLPELPPSIDIMNASDCTSLREVSGSSRDPFTYMYNVFRNCPKLFKNVTIDSEGCISKTECLDSSITSQVFIHQLSAILGYLGFETNGCEFFLHDIGSSDLDIVYHGNSIPEWFTNRSRENHVKVELPSDWCYDKFRGYETCVVFKCKKPFNTIKERCSVKNFDGASLKSYIYFSRVIEEFLKEEVIWLHYTKDTWKWKEAKNFVTFSFFEENNEDVEEKQCGVRLISDEDIQQGTHLGMLHGLPTPTQHGGAMSLSGLYGESCWSW
ncbi:NB-ARC domains-containing protein, partial [Tanacetum coccineum]